MPSHVEMGGTRHKPLRTYSHRAATQLGKCLISTQVSYFSLPRCVGLQSLAHRSMRNAIIGVVLAVFAAEAATWKSPRAPPSPLRQQPARCSMDLCWRPRRTGRGAVDHHQPSTTDKSIARRRRHRQKIRSKNLLQSEVAGTSGVGTLSETDGLTAPGGCLTGRGAKTDRG
jgi:hypothetical protein